MPTENELKFVLNKSVIPELTKANATKERIVQGYLMIGQNEALRIRYVSQPNNSITYYLTYKKYLKGRLIEIEQKLGNIGSSIPGSLLCEEQEILDLWESSQNKLIKDRYSIFVDKNLWTIDLFYDGDPNQNNVYFVQMEIEFSDPNQKEPTGKIPFAEYILWAVAQKDDRFSNTKLANVAYARELYSSFPAGVK